ncbi:MAG: hypothetical protein S4CHLAM20_09180 [Chlamydiia bacterium]|nr:hypothetical protein [Chlamydiia bacterium]
MNSVTSAGGNQIDINIVAEQGFVLGSNDRLSHIYNNSMPCADTRTVIEFLLANPFITNARSIEYDQELEQYSIEPEGPGSERATAGKVAFVVFKLIALIIFFPVTLILLAVREAHRSQYNYMVNTPPNKISSKNDTASMSDSEDGGEVHSNSISSKNETASKSDSEDDGEVHSNSLLGLSSASSKAELLAETELTDSEKKLRDTLSKKIKVYMLDTQKSEDFADFLFELISETLLDRSDQNMASWQKVRLISNSVEANYMAFSLLPLHFDFTETPLAKKMKAITEVLLHLLTEEEHINSFNDLDSRLKKADLDEHEGIIREFSAKILNQLSALSMDI